MEINSTVFGYELSLALKMHSNLPARSHFQRDTSDGTGQCLSLFLCVSEIVVVWSSISQDNFVNLQRAVYRIILIKNVCNFLKLQEEESEGFSFSGK